MLEEYTILQKDKSPTNNIIFKLNKWNVGYVHVVVDEFVWVCFKIPTVLHIFTYN